MVKTSTLAVACAGLVVVGTAASFAEIQLASPADGGAMLDRAIAALKADQASALKAFNDEKNKDFRDRDLYIYCFSLPDGNITAYQSPVMIGTNVKEKIPPNNPVGQRAYDAVAKAAESEIMSFTYDFPKPAPKRPLPRKRSKPASASRPVASVISRRRSNCLTDPRSLINRRKQKKWLLSQANM